MYEWQAIRPEKRDIEQMGYVSMHERCVGGIQYIKPLEITGSSDLGKEIWQRKLDLTYMDHLEVEKIEEEDDDEATQEGRAKVKMKEMRLILVDRSVIEAQFVEGIEGRGRSSMILRKDARGSAAADEIQTGSATLIRLMKDEGHASRPRLGPLQA
ncbi:hypothetical protein Dimus_005491 [Dionaea muscipula]